MSGVGHPMEAKDFFIYIKSYGHAVPKGDLRGRRFADLESGIRVIQRDARSVPSPHERTWHLLGLLLLGLRSLGGLLHGTKPP